MPSPLSLEGVIDEAAISDEILRDTVVKELERDPEMDAKYISVTGLDDGGHARWPCHDQPRKHNPRTPALTTASVGRTKEER
jgi:hypothetical protein